MFVCNHVWMCVMYLSSSISSSLRFARCSLRYFDFRPFYHKSLRLNPVINFSCQFYFFVLLCFYLPHMVFGFVSLWFVSSPKKGNRNYTQGPISFRISNKEKKREKTTENGPKTKQFQPSFLYPKNTLKRNKRR